MTPTAIVAYLVLFGAVGALFVFASLLIGRFVRPRVPIPEKQEIYECGEPTIGSAAIQFDLRFYVVALLFIVFDVEVAFFFPWTVVFGKATQLMGQPASVEIAADGQGAALTPQAVQSLEGLGVRQPTLPLRSGGVEANQHALAESANQLALVAMADMAVFFVILLVGFAYVWRRGDLDWIRARSAEESGRSSEEPAAAGLRVARFEPADAP
jgi:NADH-quinone oxidoreductase subunit A